MRTWTTAVAALCLSLGAFGHAARPWNIQVEWGDSTPAGTVYVVMLDNNGKLHAVRKGLPFTDEGLSTLTFDRTLTSAAVARIRTSAEQFIRQLDFDKAQGHMVGDGGYAVVKIWDGSASLAARLNLLMTREEAGKPWNTLLSMVTETLPPGFVK